MCGETRQWTCFQQPKLVSTEKRHCFASCILVDDCVPPTGLPSLREWGGRLAVGKTLAALSRRQPHFTQSTTRERRQGAKVISVSMRRADFGRHNPAAAAVAAITFAHVVTALLVWALYEVPRIQHWNHLADVLANVPWPCLLA